MIDVTWSSRIVNISFVRFVVFTYFGLMSVYGGSVVYTFRFNGLFVIFNKFKCDHSLYDKFLYCHIPIYG